MRSTRVYDASDQDDVYEPFPDHRRRGRRVMRKLLGLLATVVMLGIIGAGLAYVTYTREVDPAGPPGEPVPVALPLGTSTQRIGEILADNGVISSGRTFRVWLRLNGGGPFQAGEYTMAKNMSMSEAVARLEVGPELKYERLTVPEGLTLPQIAERVGTLEGRTAENFLGAANSGLLRSKYQPPEVTTLEGLLLPETYNLEPKDDEGRIVVRMLGSLDATAAALGYDDAQAKVGLTPYQAIVVASLIERETRFDDERPMVARVIYNRLQKNMLLQIDASVIYALGKSGERNVRVLNKDLEVDSPYNTYKFKGVPPTPIAAPGKASLEAALAPAEGNWLYYVVTETDGRHSFGTTGAEHQANIAKAVKNGVR